MNDYLKELNRAKYFATLTNEVQGQNLVVAQSILQHQLNEIRFKEKLEYDQLQS